MTSSAARYEIKTPAAVLAEDVICQSFIQSSSTLAYACLLIRRGRHDLAAHVLHSLEGRPASRFKDMVFYLQCQIGIETGEFAAVKKRLVPRVHQHPNDMVALSLLESCVFCEYEDWQRRNPHLAAAEEVAPTRAEEDVAAPAPEAEVPAADPYSRFAPPPEPSPEPASEYRTHPVPRVPGPASPSPNYLPPGDSTGSFQAISPAVPDESRTAPPTSPASPAAYASAPGDNDLGIYQSLASDANTRAFALWNSRQRRLRSVCRDPALEPLVAAMPQALPHDLERAVRALEGGDIHKICLSFEGLTLTSLHAGPENLGLVTGHINQSLLTMVRAENIFLKQGAGRGAAGGADGGARGQGAEARA